MGHYNYLLTTKSRTLTDQHGVKVEAHLIRYSDKSGSPSYGDRRQQRYENMRKARIAKADQIWGSRDWPEYVISDPEKDAIDYDTSSWPVYEGCTDSYFGEEYLSSYGIFSGYVRGQGGKHARLRFERWERFMVPIKDDRADLYAMRVRLRESGFVNPENINISIYRARGFGNISLVVSAKTTNDLVKAKVVLADLISAIRKEDRLAA